MKPTDVPFRFSGATLLPAALALALFGIVLGAKLSYIALAGSDLANWDQWDAESLHLLQPWFEGRFHWLDIFRPHNEHRIALTKLLSLAQVSLNGQWDARFQCVCNAALHASLVGAAWLWTRRLVTPEWGRATLFVALAALTASPMSWQNLLGGFHSQQVFLLWLSLAALALLLDGPAWTRRWWGGVACAALALFSMGSGFFAAAVVLGTAGVDALRFRAWHERAPTLAVMALLVVVGWFLHIDFAPHEVLKAHTLRDFALTFWRACQWPARDIALNTVVGWFPWCWLVVRVWRAELAARRHERVLAAAGAWVLLQYLAAAYARGAGAEWPADRYFDTAAVGIFVNAAAIVLFFVAPRSPGALAAGLATAALWLGMLTAGLCYHWPHVYGDLQTIGAELRRDELVTRAYLASDDRALLEREAVLPYPTADGFAQRIASPVIRAIMPVSVRQPLSMEVATQPTDFVHSDYTRGPQPLLDAPKPTGVHDGLSPATPRLDYRHTWGSFGAKTAVDWQSEPLPPPRTRWLKFEVAGDTDAPGVALQLLDARTRRPIAEVRPTKPSHDSWRAAYVRAPEREFVVAAHVTDPARWIAFSQPSEMPGISHATWVLVKNNAFVLWGSIGAALLLATFAAIGSRGRI